MNSIDEPSVLVRRSSDLTWIQYLGRDYCDITPEGAPFECSLSYMDPGGRSTRHSHSVAEQFVIISGRAIAHLGTELIVLERSESVFVPPMLEHHLSNPSEAEPLEYLLLCWSPTPESTGINHSRTERI